MYPTANSADVGAVGQAWALQTLAAAGIVTAIPTVDRHGIDLVAWFVDDDGFQAAPLQLKTTSDGKMTFFRDKYEPWIGMLYVLLTPALEEPRAAYLIRQEDVTRIGDRHFSATKSWNEGGRYFTPLERVASDLEGMELSSATANDRLRHVLGRHNTGG